MDTSANSRQVGEVEEVGYTDSRHALFDICPNHRHLRRPRWAGRRLSASTSSSKRRPFKIALSIEKDATAHKTLLLRSFFRQFKKGRVPEAYYGRLRQQLTTADLFAAHPREAAAAREETWNATLGDEASAPLNVLRHHVREALRRFPDGEDRWVLWRTAVPGLLAGRPVAEPRQGRLSTGRRRGRLLP